jgi:hypothetical protein
LLPHRARLINVLALDRPEELADELPAWRWPLFEPLALIEFAVSTGMTLLLAARAFCALSWHPPERDRFSDKVSRKKLAWQVGPGRQTGCQPREILRFLASQIAGVIFRLDPWRGNHQFDLCP